MTLPGAMRDSESTDPDCECRPNTITNITLDANTRLAKNLTGFETCVICYVKMPTIVRLENSDTVHGSSDGRGIAIVGPHKVWWQGSTEYQSKYGRGVLDVRSWDHLEHIVPGTILVSQTAFLGVVYDTHQTTETCLEAKFWPLDFDMPPPFDFKTTLMLLFSYSFEDFKVLDSLVETRTLPPEGRFSLLGDLLTDVEMEPIYHYQDNYGRALTKPSVVKHRHPIGVMKMDIPPKERPALRMIPGRETPVIDCDHIRSTKPEQTLADECLKQLSKMLFVSIGGDR